VVKQNHTEPIKDIVLVCVHDATVGIIQSYSSFDISLQYLSRATLIYARLSLSQSLSEKWPLNFIS